MRAIISFSASTLRHTQESMWKNNKQGQNKKYEKLYRHRTVKDTI